MSQSHSKNSNKSHKSHKSRPNTPEKLVQASLFPDLDAFVQPKPKSQSRSKSRRKTKSKDPTPGIYTDSAARRFKASASKVTVPLDPHPTYITKTDPNTHRPIKVMVERPVPTGKEYEKGFVQPDYQNKEEYFYVKAHVFELQKEHPENLYAMFSSVVVKDDSVIYWWKIIGPNALEYKFCYRSKIAGNRPARTSDDKDKIFHSEDGIASINSIDWLRKQFKAIGIDSSYVGLFVVEFRTNHRFSEAELENFRNYYNNIIKKFHELNQPKNLDVEYKNAFHKLDNCILVILDHAKHRDEYDIYCLAVLIHNLRGSYHAYCNSKLNREAWQTESSDILDDMEVCLQAIVDHHQNLGRTALRAQEQINAMRPSLLTKADIDRINKEMKQTIDKNDQTQKSMGKRKAS